MIAIAEVMIKFIKIYSRFQFLRSERNICDTKGRYFVSEIHVSYAFNRWRLSLLFCDESVAPMFLPFRLRVKSII